MFSKLKSLQPLSSYLIGSGIAIIASFFRQDYVVLYYGLLLLALAFIIWGIVKYFSESPFQS